MEALFFSGIGGGGKAQWPLQALGLTAMGRHLHFLDPNTLAGGPHDHAQHSLSLVPGDVHILGHSYGGITASLAAEAGGERIQSLVLFEPACLSITRDRPATRALLNRLIPAYEGALRDGVSDSEIATRVFNAKGHPVDQDDPFLSRVGANFRTWGPMWTHEVDASVYERVPTLVVTGAWDDCFEEYAEAIAEHGARHVVLPGFDHRPQDHPGANALIKEHWARVC